MVTRTQYTTNTPGLPQFQKPSQFHTKPWLRTQTGEQLAFKKDIF